MLVDPEDELETEDPNNVEAPKGDEVADPPPNEAAPKSGEPVEVAVEAEDADPNMLAPIVGAEDAGPKMLVLPVKEEAEAEDADPKMPGGKPEPFEEDPKRGEEADNVVTGEEAKPKGAEEAEDEEAVEAPKSLKPNEGEEEGAVVEVEAGFENEKEKGKEGGAEVEEKSGEGDVAPKEDTEKGEEAEDGILENEKPVPAMVGSGKLSPVR